MMPLGIGSPLPPELVDTIIQHLFDDKHALQNCALVSRTWSDFSQRALFRHTQVGPHSYLKMVDLVQDILSNPHLQTLIRNVKVYQRVRWFDYQDVPFPAYMARVTYMLSLLPNLSKVTYQEMNWPGDPDDRTAYLDLIPNVLGSAPLVELDIGTIYTTADLQHAFEVLQGTNVKRISLAGFEDRRPSTIFTERVYLPSLEHIRFRVHQLHHDFYDCLTRRLDLPNLKQCEIITDNISDLADWWCGPLRDFPPLEKFKLELPSDFLDYGEVLYLPIPFADLQFHHVHLSINPGDLDETRKLILWWSSTFRVLSESQAIIHFTEITFAFADLPGMETLEVEWNSLDESLAHATFDGVRRVWFEKNGLHTAELITEATHPVLAEKIKQCLLPRLASRRVLGLMAR